MALAKVNLPLKINPDAGKSEYVNPGVTLAIDSTVQESLTISLTDLKQQNRSRRFAFTADGATNIKGWVYNKNNVQSAGRLSMSDGIIAATDIFFSPYAYQPAPQAGVYHMVAVLASNDTFKETQFDFDLTVTDS